MEKQHVLEILIEDKDRLVLNKQYKLEHYDPNILYTDFLNRLIDNDPELEPYRETIDYWLQDIFTEVKSNWFKTVRYYGWLSGIKLFYRYKPKAPFWIRIFSGFSWGFKPLIRK